MTLDDASYPAVRLLAPHLAKVGLPPLTPRGLGSFTVDATLERGELTVQPTAIALKGVELRGSVRVLADKQLAGKGHVHVRRDYLARSPLFAIPAAVAGELVIPIDVKGTASAPDVRTNVPAILDGLLARSGAADALRERFARLRRAARRPR